MSKTIFFPPKYEEAAEQISIESPADARASVYWLTGEWNRARTREKKRRLIRFAVLAMNRAKVMLKKRDLSQKERRELKQVWKIYRRWLDTHKLR